LFDPNATATILAERRFITEQCEIKIKYAIDTQAAEHALELENLQIRHDALINEYDMRIQSLERESDALANALKKQTNRRPILWVAAGVASGIAMSYGAYRVFNEQ
jgi:FtsZ-binding cell division protein ZapB